MVLDEGEVRRRRVTVAGKGEEPENYRMDRGVGRAPFYPVQSSATVAAHRHVVAIRDPTVCHCQAGCLSRRDVRQPYQVTHNGPRSAACALSCFGSAACRRGARSEPLSGSFTDPSCIFLLSSARCTHDDSKLESRSRSVGFNAPLGSRRLVNMLCWLTPPHGMLRG